MATASYNKAPPLLSSCKTYADWKKLINIWTELTSLEKKKQGPALVLTLDGKAQEAALELSSTQISAETGVATILERLDKIYEKDKLTEKYNAIEKFETYRRPNETSIREFLIEFDKRLHKIKSYLTYPDDLLAYRLLKAANLDSTHEKLIKATISDLKFDEVRLKLLKVFSDESNAPLESEFSSVKIKSEPSFFNRESEEERSNSDEEENTYFLKRNPRFKNKYNPKSSGQVDNNWRSDRK